MFEVIATIGAGFTYHSPVNDFQAIRIMTGAEMPTSCDAIIMLEDVQQVGQSDSSKIAITQVVASGDRVFRRGSELKKGTSGKR